MSKRIYEKLDAALEFCALGVYRSVLGIGTALSIILYGTDPDETRNAT